MDLLNDKVVKKIFASGETGRLYAARIISAVLKLDFNEVEERLKIIHPNVGVNANVVDSEADLVFEANNMYVNIEVNYGRRKDLGIKNWTYVCQLCLKDINTNKDYNDYKLVVQINIDGYDQFRKGDFLYKVSLREEKYNITQGFIEEYHINLDSLRNEEYNNIKNDELKKLLYLFVCKDEKVLKRLYKGDKIMEDVEKNSKRIVEDLDLLLYYNRDDMDEKYYEHHKEEFESQFRKELEEEIKDEVTKDITDKVTKDVTDKVTKEVTKNTAKAVKEDMAIKLIKSNVDIEVISSTTGLSIERLKLLKGKIEKLQK